MTLGKAIVKTCQKEYQHGLLYTACTRVTNDNDLAFIGHDPTLVGNQFKFPSIQRYSCQYNNTFSMLIFVFGRFNNIHWTTGHQRMMRENERKNRLWEATKEREDIAEEEYYSCDSE